MSALISGKALWSVVCGTNILPSDEVVGEELEVATNNLQSGILLFKPFIEADHDKWIRKVKLKDNQKLFVARLGKMLNLSSSQCWSLFQLYLQQEYRGSSKELLSALSSYRTESRLLHNIYQFHLTDPMHLLSCRMHLLASATKKNHPYQKLFSVYLRDVLDSEHMLGSNIVSELQAVHDCITRHRERHDQCTFFADTEAPAAQSSAMDYTPGNPDLPDNAEYQWLAARLAVAKHLLATLLVYYASPCRRCPPETVYALLNMGQGGGVCGGALLVGAGQSAISSLLQDIHGLHALLLTLLLHAGGNKCQSLYDIAWRDKLDPLFSSLGSRPGHLPPLLTWSLVQGSQIRSGSGGMGSAPHYSRLAQRAVQGGVMAYLQTVLHNQAIKSDTLLSDLGCSVVYALVCAAASHLHLQDGAVMAAELAVACLHCDLPAQLFWQEEGGGAGLLLPEALSVFPARPGPLLTLCTALAMAGEESCEKVVELLSEVPSVTWSMSDACLAVSCSEVGGSQVITHSTLTLLDTFSLPAHTSGTLLMPGAAGGQASVSGQLLVQWHMPTNIWHLILAALHALDEQISSGLSVSDWLVELVEQSLKLVSSVVRSRPEELSSLSHIVQQCLTLTVRLSSVQEPKYSLLQWLLCVASAVSQHDAGLVWARLANCSLLPALPTRTRGERESIVQYYRCGTLRRLVCGDEAAAGSYPALRAYTAMLTAALRTEELGIRNSSVRGGVVFVVREVMPAVTGHWTYDTPQEKASVMEAVMEVLHHALEHGRVDQDIATEVGVQLSNAGGGALRAVLEAGATLEAALDAAPAQWPHATHASALARTAHLALSILHRLVLVYCSGPDSGPEKQRLRDLLAGERRAPSVQGLAIGGGPTHLALTVAQYVHHRLNSRLPYLALRILTKLAQELDVPLVACLGSEADVIRELLLNRMDAATEDTRVKVSISRLLTAAVSSQAGLLRAFLSPPDSLMTSLANQLATHAKTTEGSSVELVASIVELVGSLWAVGHVAAVATLRDMKEFWTVLPTSLISEPGTVAPPVLHHTLKLIALEHFVAQKDHNSQLAAGLDDALHTSLFENFELLTKHIIGSCALGQLSADQLSLVRDWRDLLVVLLSAYPAALSQQDILLLWSSVMEGLTRCMSSPEEPSLRLAAHLLSDLLISLYRHKTGPLPWAAWGRVVESLRAALLQTPAPTQLRLLTALLLALQAGQAAEDVSSIVEGLRTIVEQHCSLASAANTKHFCSNASVLQVSCSTLHLCLLQLPEQATDSLLQRSHVVAALVHAVTVHMQHSVTPVCGSDVVSSLLRLLSVLSRRRAAGQELTCQGIATSLALTLATQQQQSSSVSSVRSHHLSQVLWCAVSCMSREGVSGVEGCVSVVAVHLSAMLEALSGPQHQPHLAHSSAALVAALAPHYRLWAAKHTHSYEALVPATAACLHMTTQLIRLKGVLPRDVSSERPERPPTSDANASKDELSPTQQILLKKLLQVLLSCLRAIRLLGPDLVELLCRPGIDVQEWLPPLLQPSFRRATQPDNSQPNLATLTTVLDLCTTHLLKDKRCPPSVCSWRPLLAACGEQALLLLLAQAALALMNPGMAGREARDLCAWLMEDMNTFFSQWLGRRAASASGAECGLDRRYLRLLQHLAAQLCNQARN